MEFLILNDVRSLLSSLTAIPDIWPWESYSSDGSRWEEPEEARGWSGKLDPARLPFERGDSLLGRQTHRGHPQGISERSKQTGDYVTTLKSLGLDLVLQHISRVVKEQLRRLMMRVPKIKSYTCFSKHSTMMLSSLV